MENLNVYNIFFKNILTQSSRRSQRTMRYYQFCVSHMLFLFFIMRINRKEEFDFLITYGSLRPRTEGSMRLCVGNFK
jgi:hypothetical protein